MSTNSSPNVVELRKCLEEAGVYEENMDTEEMVDYYNAIKRSENTAEEEQEQRSIIDTAEKNYQFTEELTNSKNLLDSIHSTISLEQSKEDADSTENDIVASIITPNKLLSNIKAFTPKGWANQDDDQILDNAEAALDPNKDVTKAAEVIETVTLKDDIDVFSCPPISHKPLDIIIHKPQYSVPFYCNPIFLNMEFERRTRLIYNFHQNVLQRFYKRHCISLNSTLWGKPIVANTKFNGFLDRKVYTFSKESEIQTCENSMEVLDTSEVYTSRSGRQTKRKVYNDEYEEETSKKSKKDEDEEFEVTVKPAPKRQNLSKLNNQDIMKKSKLFADPPRHSRSEQLYDQLIESDKRKKGIDRPKSSRNEKLYEQLLEDDKKKKQTEKDIDEFRNNIKTLSDDEDVIPGSPEVSPEQVVIKPADISFPRRVPPPPLHSRKPINNRKAVAGKGRNTTNRSNEEEKGGQSQSQEVTSTHANNFSKTQLKQLGKKSQEQQQKEKAKCPICSEIFFADEIEEHAASCGLCESNFETVTLSNQNKMFCSDCDKVMLSASDYEIHEMECEAKAKFASKK